MLWRDRLPHDPLSSLIEGGEAVVSCLARRDLLNDTSRPLAWVWELPEVRDIVRRQQPDGSWRPSARATRGHLGSALVETYRELRRFDTV